MGQGREGISREHLEFMAQRLSDYDVISKHPYKLEQLYLQTLIEELRDAFTIDRVVDNPYEADQPDEDTRLWVIPEDHQNPIRRYLKITDEFGHDNGLSRSYVFGEECRVDGELQYGNYSAIIESATGHIAMDHAVYYPDFDEQPWFQGISGLDGAATGGRAYDVISVCVALEQIHAQAEAAGS